MKKMVILVCSFWIASPMQGYAVNARASKYAALPVLLLGHNLAKQDHLLLNTIQKDLSFTQQFDVSSRIERSVIHRNFIQKQFPICIVLSSLDKDMINWRLFDASQEEALRTGSVKKSGCERATAHALSDAIWHELTGNVGFFSTRLAYCRQVKGPKKRTLKHIFIADYDGSNEQVLVNTPTVNIYPRWNSDAARPIVFWSEFTDNNVRVVYTDMQKKRHIAYNYDGVNMPPAFSQDGKKAVFCASKGHGRSQLYCVTKGNLQQLTNNDANNFCPTLNEDGSQLYFCSDYGKRSPSIYCFDLHSKKLTLIPQTASSEAPSYCPVNQQLAYCKSVKGYMQLFVYDTKRQKHKQLTFDRSIKQGASWSPCGTYVLYAQGTPKQSCLRMMHISTGHIHTVVKSDVELSFPNWSPRYKQYPMA